MNSKEHNEIDNQQQPETSVILRYIRNCASMEEISAVELWLSEGEDNERYLLDISKIYFASHAIERIQSRDAREAYRKVCGQIKKRKIHIYYKNCAKIAAVLIALVVSSFLVNVLFFRGEVVESQLITVRSNPGMRTNLRLPDGSDVWLNSNSQLSYMLPFDNDERKVTVSGEAFFDVSHNPDRAFIVGINDKTGVKVLGTTFDVQVYPEDEDIRLTLVDGTVDFYTRNNRNQPVNFSLRPGYQMIYSKKTEVLAVKEVNTAQVTGWIDGKLIFKSTPMREVFRQLGHFYNVDMIVKDDVIYGYSFTGTFQNKQLAQVLKYIEITSNINCKIPPKHTDDSSGEMKDEVIVSRRR